MMDKTTIADSLFEILNPKLQKLGVSKGQVDLNDSLMDQGILDSMGFIEFISQIEEKLDIEFDFEEMDAADFTSLNQLVEIISAIA